MLHYVWPFLIYWLILFVLCYVIVEFAQNYLYDEKTPHAGWKVLGGSMILAAVLTWTRTSYDTMLTERLGVTVIQAIVWFAVFILVFRFQPVHGGAIGVVAMLLVAGLATMGVQSLSGSNEVATLPENPRVSKPLRRSIGGPPAADAAKGATPPAEAVKPLAK
jgi:hypothetical protein